MTMILRLLLMAVMSLYLGACGQRELKTLSIVSGSENESLETLIKDLGRQNGLDIHLTYLVLQRDFNWVYSPESELFGGIHEQERATATTTSANHRTTEWTTTRDEFDPARC